MHLRSWACSRGGPYAQCKTPRSIQDCTLNARPWRFKQGRTLNTWPHARTQGRAFNTGPGPYGQCGTRAEQSMQGEGRIVNQGEVRTVNARAVCSMQGRTLNGPCARNNTVRSKQNPCGQRETNLDNSKWSQMEHVPKATKETLQAGSHLTGFRAVTSSTLLRATRQAESKAHKGNWLRRLQSPLRTITRK